MFKLWASLLHALVGCLLVQTSAPIYAFEVVPTDKPNEYLKWGLSHLAGTSGGVVTWGFVAAGTPGSSYCGNYCIGKSVDTLPNFYPAPSVDNKSRSISLVSLQPVFQAAFDAWSAVADVQFQYVGVDRSLKAINDPTATSPMIRIGIWRYHGLIAYFCSAAAFPPRLKGGNGAAHVFINSNVGYQLSSAPDNSRQQDFPVGGGLYMTDLYLLALQEIGHTIGLADSTDPDSVMTRGDSSATLRAIYLWRRPRADDIAGAQFLYGGPRKGSPD